MHYHKSKPSEIPNAWRAALSVPPCASSSIGLHALLVHRQSHRAPSQDSYCLMDFKRKPGEISSCYTIERRQFLSSVLPLHVVFKRLCSCHRHRGRNVMLQTATEESYYRLLQWVLAGSSNGSHVCILNTMNPLTKIINQCAGCTMCQTSPKHSTFHLIQAPHIGTRGQFMICQTVHSLFINCILLLYLTSLTAEFQFFSAVSD